MKGHTSTGYIGTKGTYTTGGKFFLPEQQRLKSQGLWPPIDIVTTGLQTYLDASDSRSYSGSGTAWNDLSGNARTFNFASTPTYNSGAVKSFGSTVRCLGPESNSFGITNSTGYTIFMTLNQNSLTSTSAFKFYGSGGNTRGIFAHCTWSDGNIYFDQGGCCGTDTRTNIAMTSPSTGAWKVIGFRSNSTNERSIWQNGTNTVSNTTAPAAINLNTTQADIFISNEYTGWSALVGQFVVYNRALSDAEMVSVTNVLKPKVGL